MHKKRFIGFIDFAAGREDEEAMGTTLSRRVDNSVGASAKRYHVAFMYHCCSIVVRLLFDL